MIGILPPENQRLTVDLLSWATLCCCRDWTWLPKVLSIFLALTSIVDAQETPSVGVEDRSDYLRSGNAKPDDQSLGLPDQEEAQLARIV